MAKKGVHRHLQQHQQKKKKLTNRELQELLIENFVGLQRAMTNLSFKFEGLSEQIAKLLQIFELAAKNYMTGNETEESKRDVLRKINSLLEQNKVIAGGLIAIEEKMRSQPELMEIAQRTMQTMPQQYQQNPHPQQPQLQKFQERPKPRPLPRI